MSILTIPNLTVVVSRNNEDVKWLQKLTSKGIRVVVYDHQTSSQISTPYNLQDNYANEAGVYLRYICDYYDNLSIYTIFIHAHEHSWHHQGSMADLILGMLAKKEVPKAYTSFNNLCMGSVKNTLYKHMCRYWDKYLKPYIGPRSAYGDWTKDNVCCAQFLVHKRKIQTHPKKMYTDLYKYVSLRTKLDAKATGHLLEWTWHRIFGADKPPRDQCKRVI